jgi:Immunoglobulin-like domain of bacterial spore germination
MKKIGIFMLGIAFMFGLSACSQGPITQEEPKPIVDPPNKVEDKIYENKSFKEVMVKKVDGSVVVTGMARVFEGVFQFAVVSNGKVNLQDHYQTDGAPAWGEFEISFDQELADKEGASLELFVYSAKDGSKIDILTIPLN